ncbi:TetR/AcrR family transcriptional regulator [Timonella senegalensis]|uniref:TetR/AcrR family transcriptional regulator n=1 Tax=Timonella senegalensis TaxID=1465825 RepID=UPI002FE08A69
MSSITEKSTDDGRSTRWEWHRAQRREELARAARKAVHLHGTDISMDDIATFAGTSKSIVYRYFNDKPGLQRAVGEAVMQQIHESLAVAATQAATPKEALRSMVASYLGTIDHSPNVYYFITRDAPGLPLLDSMIEIVAFPFAQEMKVPLSEAHAWAAGAVGFVRGTGEWWLEAKSAEDADLTALPTLDDLTESITTWLWSGPVMDLVRSRTHHTKTT